MKRGGKRTAIITWGFLKEDPNSGKTRLIPPLPGEARIPLSLFIPFFNYIFLRTRYFCHVYQLSKVDPNTLLLIFKH